MCCGYNVICNWWPYIGLAWEIFCTYSPFSMCNSGEWISIIALLPCAASPWNDHTVSRMSAVYSLRIRLLLIKCVHPVNFENSQERQCVSDKYYKWPWCYLILYNCKHLAINFPSNSTLDDKNHPLPDTPHLSQSIKFLTFVTQLGKFLYLYVFTHITPGRIYINSLTIIFAGIRQGLKTYFLTLSSMFRKYKVWWIEI